VLEIRDIVYIRIWDINNETQNVKYNHNIFVLTDVVLWLYFILFIPFLISHILTVSN